MNKSGFILSVLLFFVVESLFVLLNFHLLYWPPVCYISVFLINTVCVWFFIKNIEKLYYPKYDKLSSMLYNLCPFIGVVILYLIAKYILKSEITGMFLYFVYLFLSVYIFNGLYILFKTIIKKYK